MVRPEAMAAIRCWRSRDAAQFDSISGLAPLGLARQDPQAVVHCLLNERLVQTPQAGSIGRRIQQVLAVFRLATERPQGSTLRRYG